MVDTIASPTIDAITLEIVQGTVESARREMELQVERTARSVIIRERRDYRAAVFDAQGRNVSSASGGAHVDPILENYAREDIQEGDVFVWNDPFKSAGGLTHLPDICITEPVFFEGEIAGYAQVFGHVLDIGGIVPGSLAIGATEIFQEGLIIPPVRLVQAGKLNEALYRTILNNSRFPEDLRGDLDAEIMACHVGAKRFKEMLTMYGRERVDVALEEVLEGCARALREKVLPLIPDGRFEFEDFVEINGVVPAEKRKFIRLRVAMYREDDTIVFDFNGTDAQSAASINIAGNERYYVKYLTSIFRLLVPDVIFNAGALRVIKAKVPEGTVLSAKPPASCSYRANTLFRVPDLCMGALSKALGGFGAANSDTRSVWRYSGQANGRTFLLHDGIGAGAGGRPHADGADAVTGNVAGVSVPVEYFEATYPVRIEECGLAYGSAGAGRHRGGLGIHKECRFLAPGSLWIFDDRQVLQPWGVGGGEAGEGTSYVLNAGKDDEQIINYKATNIRVKPGDLLSIRTPGGGGWGDPLDRDPALVAHDVLNSAVTVAMAHDIYGVVLVDGVVDEAATATRRTEMRTGRGDLPMIDRGPRFRSQLEAGEISLTTDDTQPLPDPSRWAAIGEVA